MTKTLRNSSFLVLVALMIGATATGCGKKPGTTSSEGGSSGGTASDLDRLQGVWAVESWDMASEEKKDKDGKVDAKQNAFEEEFKKELLNANEECTVPVPGKQAGHLD